VFRCNSPPTCGNYFASTQLSCRRKTKRCFTSFEVMRLKESNSLLYFLTYCCVLLLFIRTLILNILRHIRGHRSCDSQQTTSRILSKVLFCVIVRYLWVSANKWFDCDFLNFDFDWQWLVFIDLFRCEHLICLNTWPQIS